MWTITTQKTLINVLPKAPKFRWPHSYWKNNTSSFENFFTSCLWSTSPSGFFFKTSAKATSSVKKVPLPWHHNRRKEKLQKKLSSLLTLLEYCLPIFFLFHRIKMPSDSLEREMKPLKCHWADERRTKSLIRNVSEPSKQNPFLVKDKICTKQKRKDFNLSSLESFVHETTSFILSCFRSKNLCYQRFKWQ